MKALFTFMTLVLLIAPSAHAQVEGRYEVAIKKQEEKKQSRWSLNDWLQQKQKNRMMDLWLARNSQSSPFEFFFEAKSINYGQYNGAAPETVVNRNSYSGAIAAYAGIAGLRGSYEGDTENRSAWNGSFNLRILGRALQDTHVNIEYGLRGMTLTPTPQTSENFQNQFGGVSLNLYLSKYFGLEGTYRKILPAQSDRLRTLEGETSQGGVFIDFSIFRVFGEWKKEFLKYDGGGRADSSEFREGFGGGFRLYF